jgi:ADP-ribose pyrophosphatase
MKPEVLSERTIYTGRVFELSVAEIRENDVTYTREIVKHHGSAVIVPLFEDGSVALVRQYRHAAGEFLLEIPAGTLDAGEDPAVGAARELEEEIGVTAAKIEKLCDFYVSPGFLTEKMNLFLATGLTATAQNLDADEFLSVARIQFTEALEMVNRNEIKDAKTIIGLILTSQKLLAIQ